MSFLVTINQALKATSLGVGALLCAMLGAPSLASEAPKIQHSAPPDFENFEQERTLLLDFYFGGRVRGTTLVSLSPETISFLNVDEVVDLLPEVADQEAVIHALGGKALATNAHLACSSINQSANCGRLSPEMAGVIVDRDNFRVEIFLNPVLLEVKGGLNDRYLPPPDRGLSLINSIGGVVSGSSGGDDIFGFQDQLVLASGDKRLRADFTYSDQFGFGAERLVFEWDVPERRYSAGALWVPGNALLGRRKILGLGLETQVDTRIDKDSIIGSPVVVFLERRARVDLLREGRVLSSKIYEAGNQVIDTSNLPDGSYDILLRIEEAGGATREERRFFTKSRRIPVVGRDNFFIFGGLLVSDYDPGSLNVSSRPYLQGGLVHRASEDWALDAGAQASLDQGSLELGATFLTKRAQFRAAAIAETTGAYGTTFQLSSTGTSRFNYNFDFRRMRGDSEEGTTPLVGAPVGSNINDFDLRRFSRSGNYTQLGGVISYSTNNLRFLGTGFYRDETSEPARYSIGPSVEWDVYRKGQVQVTLRADLTATEGGKSAFAGISFRLTGKRTTVAARGGARKSGIENDSIGDGAVAAISGTWNTPLAGGEFAAGAGFEHLPREDNYIFSTEVRHPTGSLSGDLVHSERSSGETTQYALGFQTTIVAGAGVVDVAGRTTSDSAIVASVDGARHEDRFEVIVDEHVAGIIEGDEKLSLPLPSYRSYKVRMRPIGLDLLSYDGATRDVGLYPGGIVKLSWKVAPITIKFGRLIDESGAFVAHATITGKGVWTETDDQGYFQIEVADNAELIITRNDGRSFAMTLPSADTVEEFAQLGDVACCQSANTQLAALQSGRD